MAKTDAHPEPTSVTPALTKDLEGAMYLEGQADGQTPEDMALAIVTRIMAAETAEDILAGPGSILGAEDLINQVFMLKDIEFRESAYKVGPKAFALLHVTRDGGEDELVTCGARNVMAAAFTLKKRGFLPRGGLTIVEGNETKAGFTPLWLTTSDKIPEGRTGESLQARNERIQREDAAKRVNEPAF